MPQPGVARACLAGIWFPATDFLSQTGWMGAAVRFSVRFRGGAGWSAQVRGYFTAPRRDYVACMHV